MMQYWDKQTPKHTPGIDSTAVISPSAKLGKNVSIGAYSVIDLNRGSKTTRARNASASPLWRGTPNLLSNPFLALPIIFSSRFTSFTINHFIIKQS